MTFLPFPLRQGLGCLWTDAITPLPGVPYKGMMTHWGLCTIEAVHYGWTYLAVACGALLLLGFIGIRSVSNPDARPLEFWDSVGFAVVVAVVGMIAACLLYILAMILHGLGDVLAPFAALLLGGALLLYTASRWLNLSGLPAAWRRARTALSLTAALERRRQRAQAVLTRAQRELTEQLQQLRSDDYGRRALEEVERILSEP